MTEFRGARGSNTGDDFHELWATRQAIRLLLNEDGLEALAVEGLAALDEAKSNEDMWDGVDCTLYFGGRNARKASQVVLQQLKYSAAAPEAAWTVARLAGGTRRDRSVIARLAKAWKGVMELRQGGSPPGVVLISNQPVDPEVISAFARAAAMPVRCPIRRPRPSAAAESRLAYAAGLSTDDFHAFSRAIRFEAGTGSRFALEEQVLRAIADWTDHDVQQVVTGLRQFVRQRMRPEFAGELITRESVTLHLGASEGAALFPCPSEITRTEAPVSRAPVREATGLLISGVQHVCLHGKGGVGKTTALQEIKAELPFGSIMVTYDCYGGGRYLDPSALRHRPIDAFLQLTNELAARLTLPLLLSRNPGSDYPRLFASRLKHAANAVAAQHPGALIVIAVDAADNVVTAAQTRSPVERSFIHDFVLLTGQPENVRFVVTARTGRLGQLQLPSFYQAIEIKPFSRAETGENVKRIWPAPDAWIDDFHHLSSGVPRVQAYAFEGGGTHPSAALDRLRPAGKSLDEVFRQQFDEALRKTGSAAEVAKLCAGLIVLPRPVPLRDLAAVLRSTEAELADICADLAPGIRLHEGTVGFADEDFEHFVRGEGARHLTEVQQEAAAWLLHRASLDRYAALNVAAALAAAGRGAELLELVEREPAPMSVADPVLRREAELQRLRLAIKVCREAGDVSRALRFVLIGAEGVKTEAALRELLVSNPDMAANFAYETAGRLILSDRDHIEDHGPLLFQRLSVDAIRGDAISVREGRRSLRAWMQARKHDYDSVEEDQYRSAWEISISDISSSVEAALSLEGPLAALEALGSWAPRRIALDVALSLPCRLIAEGRSNEVEAVAAENSLGPVGRFFLLMPLVLAGHSVDINAVAQGLETLSHRRLNLKGFFDSYHEAPSLHGRLLDTVLTACEVLASRGAAPELVDTLLGRFLAPELRRIDRRHPYEATKLDLLFRAYALREARVGRVATTDGIFELRPESPSESQQRRVASSESDHDRPLMELARAVFGIYTAVADALVHQRTEVELGERLRRAAGHLRGEEWRLSRQYSSGAMRGQTATSLLVLLSAGYDARALKQFAADIHGHWRSGQAVPNEQLVARLCLRHELHASLVEDLAAGAAETRTMRIGADEKSKALVGYARLLKPISPPDANEVFNQAVEAASELDREAMAQLRLLDLWVSRGAGSFGNARGTAQQMADVVADAAIRLDGHRDFPWDEAISALARLDTPLALANAARWDDESIAKLQETLPSLLKTALRTGSLTPSQGAAVALFLDGDHGVLAAALEQADAARIPSTTQLAEEAALDVLVRHRHFRSDAVTQFVKQHGSNGVWTDALLRQNQFLSLQSPDLSAGASNEFEFAVNVDDSLKGHVWDRETLVESERLRAAVSALWDQGRAEQSYLPASRILESARGAVAVRDRVAHLSALADLEDPKFTDDAVEAMLHAIGTWWESPAVQGWCRATLPEVIVTRLPELSHSMHYGKDDLTAALRRTGRSEAELQMLVLRGIERHVDGFGSDRIFALAGLIGRELAPPDAAGLVDWYAERLALRIPQEDRDQTAPDAILPQNTNEAVARFVFAYMGDWDLRMRWRAAHAVRRLARTGDIATLTTLVAQYERQGEVAFRSARLPFYWLGARLWFVLAWDRIAGERPEIAGRAGRALLQIALDDTFPHLLVRSFARDACEKLVAAGHLSLNAEEMLRLQGVNQSPFPRLPAEERTLRHFAERDEGRRFKFDWMDTLEYWYEPWLKSFANVDGEQFLQAAERWIIDVWGYSGDIRDFDKERRAHRLERDWALSSTHHGSKPTLERLNNHLEWHAMWCAAGELLKTHPLAATEDEWDESWYGLAGRVRREKLAEPPLWSADLLVPIPLIVRNWSVDTSPLEEWVLAVAEADHRAEIFPDDRAEYLVVDAYVERRVYDRTETIRVMSALVDPDTGGALLRALQTMDDSWDYKLPEEGEENVEIDQEPYRLLGWLRKPEREGGIDEKDPLRGYATIITVRPGPGVMEACQLTRDAAGQARWESGSDRLPMFVYEVWGESDEDDERYAGSGSLSVAGNRLLAHKEQLREFLQSQGLDLVLEVEVTRRDRETRRFAGQKEKKIPEGRFDRLYKLGSRGALDIAEGCLGTWTGDRPRA